MRRRRFLRAGLGLAAAGATTASAGCLGVFETQPAGIPPVPENRPDAVYVPSHEEGMASVGMGTAGDYEFGLMYSFAHRFWNVNGRDVEKTGVESSGDDAVHLMAVVWDPETKLALPETGMDVDISRDGEFVSQETIYPMLSQVMGFHYGANFTLEGDGTYDVNVSVGGMSTRRTGSFAERFADPASTTIEFEYSSQRKDGLSFETRDDAGEKGALEPNSMMDADSTAPAVEDLPGRVVGQGTSNDAVLVTTVLDAPPEGVDGDGQYLAVSARTPYNRMVVPAMGLDGAVTRDGQSVFEGELVRTFDPDLGYHYGAPVESLQSGDDVTLSVTTWPQTARHEGYETAFGGLLGDGMPDVTFTAK
ncbi:iron transporter [Halomarina salina]|uniref:Iron transporter n=1 Tax=Halomarina salina TaxID=1872699 RepID=A0ABD5RIM3_9EURY|nr:iron transporter [Halomarina salina]